MPCYPISYLMGAISSNLTFYMVSHGLSFLNDYDLSLPENSPTLKSENRSSFSCILCFRGIFSFIY